VKVIYSSAPIIEKHRILYIRTISDVINKYMNEYIHKLNTLLLVSNSNNNSSSGSITKNSYDKSGIEMQYNSQHFLATILKLSNINNSNGSTNRNNDNNYDHQHHPSIIITKLLHLLSNHESLSVCWTRYVQNLLYIPDKAIRVRSITTIKIGSGS